MRVAILTPGVCNERLRRANPSLHGFLVAPETTLKPHDTHRPEVPFDSYHRLRRIPC
jgi:hypothetical protein